MGKVKINLTSGNVLEKPIITCFQGNNSNYIVLDNEKNGSMGLPIICISKINGSNLDKIIDQNEWASVKESLKSIISGNKMNYLAVSDNLSAPDDFFTQLTLPVASFDALKNGYQLPQSESVPAQNNDLKVVQNNEVAPVNNQINTNDTAVSASPVAGPLPVVPDVMPISAPAIESAITPAPVTPIVEPTNTPAAVISPAPLQADSSQLGAVSITQPEAVVVPPIVNNDMQNVAPVAVSEVPPVQTVPNTNPDLEEIKSAFMKSCENMFEALVNKFQNK